MLGAQGRRATADRGLVTFLMPVTTKACTESSLKASLRIEIEHNFSKFNRILLAARFGYSRYFCTKEREALRQSVSPCDPAHYLSIVFQVHEEPAINWERELSHHKATCTELQTLIT